MHGVLLPSAGQLWYFFSIPLTLTRLHHTVAADRRCSALTVINVIFPSETQRILKLKSQNSLLKYSGGGYYTPTHTTVLRLDETLPALASI